MQIKKDFYVKLDVEKLFDTVNDVDITWRHIAERLKKEIMYLDQQLYIRNKYVKEMEEDVANKEKLVEYLRQEIQKVENEKI